MEKREKENVEGFGYIKTTDENGKDIFLYPATRVYIPEMENKTEDVFITIEEPVKEKQYVPLTTVSHSYPDEPQHQTIEEDSPVIIQSPRGLNNAGIMGANLISKTIDLGLNLRGSFDIETDAGYARDEIKYTPELVALMCGEYPIKDEMPKKIIMGYDINDKPFEIVTDVTDAGNIELFTEEQIPIIVKMLHVLENQGAETLWSMMTPEMYELAMNHSILSYELEEYYIEDDNKYNLVIDKDLNDRYGLTISIFGKDYDE